MKLLITGASGFIGSRLVELALEADHEVWAAVRATTSRKYLQDPRIHLLVLPFESGEKLYDALLRHRLSHGAFQACIHAAGATKCANEAAFLEANTATTVRLAEALLKASALEGRFIYMSSLSAMGDAERFTSKPICPTSLIGETTAYGRSKLQAELLLQKMPQLDLIILRPTGVYGPREKDYFMMAQSIARHVDFAVGFKPQQLTFIYVDDLCHACLLATTRGISGHAYLLSDGGTYTSRTFSLLLQQAMNVRGVLHLTVPLFILRAVCYVSERLARLNGTTSTLNSDKYLIMSQRNWACSILEAREELGFDPQWPLERGVKQTVKWYKENGWLK